MTPRCAPPQDAAHRDPIASRSEGFPWLATALLPRLFFVWAAGLVAVGLTAASDLPMFRQLDWPPPLTIGFLLLYVAIAWFYRPSGPCGWRNPCLAACLFALYLSCRAAPLGDYGLNWMLARESRLPLSESGSVFISCLVVRWFGAGALELMAPISGLAVAWGLLWICERFFVADRGDKAYRRRVAALGLLTGGYHLVFFRGHIEHTQFSIPPLVLYFAWLGRYVEGSAAVRSGWLRPLDVAVLGLAVACLIHGIALFLLPALPIAVLVVRSGSGEILTGLQEILRAAVLFVAVVGAAFATYWLLGFEIVTAFLGDEKFNLLVGFSAASSPTGSLLSIEHWRFVAGAFLLATPVVLLALVVGPLAVLGRREGYQPRWWLALCALGYMSFISLFKFELGLPRDHDLLLTLSFTLVLAILDVISGVVGAGRIGRATCVAILLGASVLSWSSMAPLLTGPFATPVAADPGRGRLLVNGVLAQGVDAATPVSVPRDRGLEIEVIGPPGCTFLVLVGPGERRGIRFWRRFGVACVGTPPAFEDLVAAWHGRFDERGRAVLHRSIADRAPGSSIAMQAMIDQPWGDEIPFVFTPALRVDVQ